MAPVTAAWQDWSPRSRSRASLTQLANLAQLPLPGAVVVFAPLKLVRGTASPAWVLALVPRG
jgi:kynurenine formamidase